MAWLARITMLCGGQNDEAGVQTLKKALDGEPVPVGIVEYWKLWAGTEAWKAVYQERLH